MTSFQKRVSLTTDQNCIQSAVAEKRNIYQQSKPLTLLSYHSVISKIIKFRFFHCIKCSGSYLTA